MPSPPTYDWPQLSAELQPLLQQHAVPGLAAASTAGARGKAYYLLGDRLLAAKDFDAAACAYLVAHQEAPFVSAYVNLGVALQQGGRLDAAHAALSLAIAHRPSHSAEAYRNLALLPPRPGLASRATLLTHAVAAAPQSAELRLSLGTELRHEDLPAAVTELEAVLALEPSAAAANTLGEAYLASSRVEEAVLLLRRAAAAAPHNAGLCFWVGTGLQAAYRTREAGAAFAASLRLDPLLSVRTARNAAGFNVPSAPLFEGSAHEPARWLPGLRPLRRSQSAAPEQLASSPRAQRLAPGRSTDVWRLSCGLQATTRAGPLRRGRPRRGAASRRGHAPRPARRARRARRVKRARAPLPHPAKATAMLTATAMTMPRAARTWRRAGRRARWRSPETLRS